MQAGSSDIHLEEESPIAVRINSDIKIIEKLALEKIEEVFNSAFPDVQTMLPLFFNYDLSSENSLYIKNKIIKFH